MLTDTQWAMLEQCRPKGKTPPQDLRRTFEAILWRHENGAKWRAVPAELGPWWRAAQTFIRWARLGVWERLLNLVQECGWTCFRTMESTLIAQEDLHAPHTLYERVSG